ncbi:MAG: hypothetical protein R6V02_01860 [Candidatus Aminicenantes bacterium]
MKKKAKNQSMPVLLALFLTAVFTPGFARENSVDRATVPFSNPSQPGTVKVQVYRGSITVQGYDGQEVIIEAGLRTMRTAPRDRNPKAEGMTLLRANTTGLTIMEEDNVMTVGTLSLHQSVDISLQVPRRTSLKLKAFQGGDIVVENVAGEIEANNHGGSLLMSGIAGSVVAHIFNGEVKIVFTGITPDKPMSFTTFNGDIDVTLPANVKTDVMIKSVRGDIYSDFKIKLNPLLEKSERAMGIRSAVRRPRIPTGEYLTGTINGGGPVYQFESFTGDIFIRKK